MKKILIALQGPLNSNTIKCAESFADLNLDVLMIAWKDNSLKKIYSKKVKIDMIDDPKTLFTRLTSSSLII